MVNGDAVYACLAEFGPMVPAEVVSKVGSNTIIVGAILSDMARSKRLLITHGKWGSSPLYYLPLHKDKIQRLYEKMNDKDKKAFTLIKEKLVLCDEQLNALERTCIRSLTDFAIPIVVKTDQGELNFFKWYLADDEQIRPLIKEILDQLHPQIHVEQIPLVTQTTAVSQSASLQTATHTPLTKLKTEKTPFSPTTVEKMAQKALSNTSKASIPSASAEKQTTLQPQDEFFDKIVAFCEKKNIQVITCQVVKKNTEFDLTVHISSSLGELEYFMKVKKKKKSSEADITQTFSQAAIQKLPGCYTSLGECTKKATELAHQLGVRLLVVS